jgi:hypothetical protein
VVVSVRNKQKLSQGKIKRSRMKRRVAEYVQEKTVKTSDEPQKKGWRCGNKEGCRNIFGSRERKK